MKRSSLLCYLLFLFISFNIFAQSAKRINHADPISCMVGTFSAVGDKYWQNITLTLQNKCGQTVDVRNTTITFKNSEVLNTNFWGEFGVISYPDNNLIITSQPLSTGGYLAAMYFHISEAAHANSKLPSNGIIKLFYGAPKAGFDASTLKIYFGAPAVQSGKIKIQVPVLPDELSGYAENPVITLTNINNENTSNYIVNWNATTTLDQLTNGTVYRFSTSDIIFNNYRCSGIFSPTQAASDAAVPPNVLLNYTCARINPVNITLNVSGLTSSTSSVNVTFTPNNGSAPVTKSVNLTNGNGSSVVSLTQDIQYNISVNNIPGYSTSFQPQPLTAVANATENVTYTALPPSSGGRTIGYIPGWKQPPSATALANAGYTHALIAFGVFSTSTPGVIVPAFDTVSKSYIDSLHNAGIKVLLSLGGASTSSPNTSVDFHQVLQMASSPSVFQQTFIQSVKNLTAEYGFDGIDIDIEHGLGVGGTMQSPTGDVAVLAGILNQIHNDLPYFMITLAPQTANISATSGFDSNWGNYAALIMQTHNALTWVGIQLYNSGCMFGIDHVCYDPNQTNTPNFSVSMAADMLEDWPQIDSSGRPTGFQPYISYLTSDQVVLGYPSPDAQGNSDGRPVTPNSTIKRAIQCLQTAQAGTASCGSYVPPKAYGLVGGVFNWEVTYDQNNQFKFARELKTCVTTGVCT